MKRLTLILAMMAFGFAANAQTVEVQSAIGYLKKDYLGKAKESIDKATVHEQTKQDAKTWCYRGLIYSKLGGEAKNPKSKYKDLAPDWCDVAYEAALRCKELDVNNEFAESNNTVFGFIGAYLYDQAVKTFNEEQNYAKAIELAEKAIVAYNNVGDLNASNGLYYIAGLAGKNMKNNEIIKKYFVPLTTRKANDQFAQSSIPTVFRTLFDIYKGENDTTNAVKLANRYAKTYKNDFNGQLMLAEAYLWTGNIEKGKEAIENALNVSKDNQAVYTQLLCQAAAILEVTEDYASAEEKYAESLRLNADQFAANYGMGKMVFNRGVDKKTAADNVPLEDETGLSDKLYEEANGLFRQAIPYFVKAIAVLDAIQDPQQQAMQKPNLYNCLFALNQIYVRLEMYDDAKVIKARLEAIQAGN